MATKSSTKTSFIFLCMNLFCYVLTATAHGNSTIPSRSLGPQLCGGFFGGFGGSTGGATTGQQPAMCPRDTLKLGVCANLLGGLVGAVVGNPPVTTPCCTLLEGLADLNAAVCLCTAIKANVLGINLNIPVSLSLLLNVCGKTPPTGFVCA